MREHHTRSIFFIFTFFLLSILIEVPAFANGMCAQGAKNLRGDNNIIQGNGGIWSFMERNGLNDHSVMGMQIDSKMQRTIVSFETMCDDGKIPSMETFKAIEDLLAQARSIKNSSPDRTPLGKILDKIKLLNSNLDKMVEKIGN